MTTHELLELTTGENLKKLAKEKENECDKFEAYAHLKILEKRLVQAEVIEKNIEIKSLLLARYISVTEFIFNYIRKLC
jgi:hypothetical protein|nr:MAG TPA: hypothetical protein [Caudoviricetes sp.]